MKAAAGKQYRKAASEPDSNDSSQTSQRIGKTSVSLNIKNKRTSQPAVPNETIRPVAVNANINAFKKASGRIQIGFEK